jgi:hypothetical protein
MIGITSHLQPRVVTTSPILGRRGRVTRRVVAACADWSNSFDLVNAFART